LPALGAQTLNRVLLFPRKTAPGAVEDPLYRCDVMAASGLSDIGFS